MSQADRLLQFLKERGSRGATSLEIISALKILNTTGRISDLRASGHTIDCIRDHELYRYIYKGSSLKIKIPKYKLTEEEKAWIG